MKALSEGMGEPVTLYSKIQFSLYQKCSLSGKVKLLAAGPLQFFGTGEPGRGYEAEAQVQDFEDGLAIGRQLAEFIDDLDH
jgi:hypothetical protein